MEEETFTVRVSAEKWQWITGVDFSIDDSEEFFSGYCWMVEDADDR